MTSAKQTELALQAVEQALALDLAHPQHPGVHGHLTAAHVQLEAVAKLLAPGYP